MKVKILFYLCLLLVVSSCDKSAIIDECLDAKPTSRSIGDKFSYFLNIEQYTDEFSGNTGITGDIICTEETEYTFILGFNSSSGVKYEAAVGDDIKLNNTNGSFCRVTTKLKPGVHHCFVRLYFSNSNQTGYARLVVDKINGSSPVAEGSGDLVAMGTSKIINQGGSETYHWVCSKCNTLNSMGANSCVACGNNK